MAENYTQVAPNSTGNKMRTRSRTIGANTVHEQGVFQAAVDTWYALADAVAFAANKQHISILNASGSGVVVKVRKIFPCNLALAALTGVALRFDFKKATAHAGGTAITPVSADSTNTALPAQVTVRTGATSVTESSLLWPYTCTNDEVGATQAFPSAQLMQALNSIPDGNEIQELTLREGEGLTVKQITSSTVGSFGWLMVFTVETP